MESQRRRCVRCGKLVDRVNSQGWCASCVNDELLNRPTHGGKYRRAGWPNPPPNMFTDVKDWYNQRAYEFTVNPRNFEWVRPRDQPRRRHDDEELQDWKDRAIRAEEQVRQLGQTMKRMEHDFQAQISRLSQIINSRDTAPRASNGSISADMLKKILSLVHPDKHSGSEVATEVTRYILSLRER